MLLVLAHLRLALVFATGALLTACESKPAATSQPIDTPKPAVLAAPTSRTISVIPVPPALLVATNAAASGPNDSVALYKPFAYTRTVAPGLQLIISSVPMAGTAVGTDSDSLSMVLTLRKNRRVIFRDTAQDDLAYTAYSEPQTAKLYPIWIPTGPDAGQLLVAYSNRPSRDNARRFFIRGRRVIKIDTLPAFTGPAKDYDQDGRPEYAGLTDYGEEWGEEAGPHYQTYNPMLYYEVRPMGLAFDSALTKRKALAQYGVFQGYKYSEKPGVLVGSKSSASRR